MDLKKIHTHTNSAKTNLRFESPADSALSLDEKDEFTKGLVDYAAGGGGNIILRVKNYRRRFNTKNTIKETSVSEAEIIGKNGKQILDVFKELF